MKNILLFLFLAGLTAFSVGQVPTPFDISKSEKIPVRTPDPDGVIAASPVIGQKLSEAIIGESWYDLQSYGSMQQRMYVWPDGTIGAAWMMAFETTGWSDRGIGYNYYDGNSWGPYPTVSVASIRTGWVSYAPLGVNGEVTVGHALPNTDWVLWFCKRDNKGTGAWEEFTLEGPQPGVGLVWPAIVTNGADHNTLHVLALTYGDPYNDQASALLYSRSTDGGLTWDIENEFFDDIDYDYFTTIDADGFAWAAPKGNTLAFSVGFDAGHGCIMKSTDNGDNWEFTEVFNCPFYPPPGDLTPTFGAGDGSEALAIDNSGMVHLVYGRMRHYYDETGAGFYYPYTDGLIYWNESMPPLDTTIISTYTLENLQNNGNLAGWVVDPGISGIIEIPSYYTSLTSYPQITIDASNRIFVLWSGVAPGYDNGLWNYRHIYGNSSNDGGATWNGIKDLNEGLLYIFSECIYPVMAPTLYNDEIHFYFENDNNPGIFVWAEQQAEAGNNNFTYMSQPTSFLTGVNDPAQPPVHLEVSQNYPNPFGEITYIDVKLPQPGNMVFTVSDLTGRTVYVKDYGSVSQNQFRIRFDSHGLSAGIYYYTIKSERGDYTGKMMLK